MKKRISKKLAFIFRKLNNGYHIYGRDGRVGITRYDGVIGTEISHCLFDDLCRIGYIKPSDGRINAWDSVHVLSPAGREALEEYENVNQ